MQCVGEMVNIYTDVKPTRFETFLGKSPINMKLFLYMQKKKKSNPAPLTLLIPEKLNFYLPVFFSELHLFLSFLFVNI